MTSTVSRVHFTACLLLAMLATALHSPGHLSADSSVQLHEAATGVAVGWSPPFTSALLRWLGGGELASALLVLLQSAATYFGLYLAFAHRRDPAADGTTGASCWLRGLVATVLVLNPVVFLYVGIVWKDVLLATLSVLSLGVCLSASRQAGNARLLLCGLSLLLLLPLPMVRQQGLFLLPLLAIPPLLVLLAGRAPRVRLVALAFTLAAMAASYVWLGGAVEASIQRGDGRDISVGLRSLKVFDLAGIEKRVETGPFARSGASPVELAAIDALYTGERVDYVADDPLTVPLFGRLEEGRIDELWRESLGRDWRAYLAHRAEASAWLFGMHGVGRCLPVHVGVEGIPGYLDPLRIERIQDPRDAWLYARAVPLFETPLFGHWFYAAALLVVTAASVVLARGLRRWMLLSYALAIAAFYASFVPTAIACDFRYLYFGIPMVTALALALLAGDRDMPAPR